MSFVWKELEFWELTQALWVAAFVAYGAQFCAGNL